MDAEKDFKEAVKKGNQVKIRSSFERFYNTYWKLACDSAIKSVGYRDWINDVVQDAFLYLLSNVNRIGEMDSPKEYLLQTVRQLARETYAKETLKATKEYNDESELNGTQSGIPEFLEQQELIQRIQAILPHPDSDIVILREGYDLTFKEISKELNLGEDLVFYRHKKAIKTLKEKLRQ